MKKNSIELEINKVELAKWDEYLKSNNIDYNKLRFGYHSRLCTYNTSFPDGTRFCIRICSTTPKEGRIYCYGAIIDLEGNEVKTNIRQKLSGNWTICRKNGRKKEYYVVEVIENPQNEIMTENYCDDCDEVLNVPFDATDFWNFKVGRIRCKCGCIVKPCNECFGTENHDTCGNCPWENAEIKDAMTDKEFMLWCRENEPATYEMYKGDSNGDYFHKVIAEIESEDEKGTD